MKSSNIKRIMILGAAGMAGHVLYYYLRGLKKYNIITVVHNNKVSDDSIIMDIREFDNLKRLLNEKKPDIIINCIGLLIRQSTENPKDAILINSYLPHLLIDCARQINAKLIHISTDCVFSGEKGSYAENDTTDANDIYGKSKSLGEITNEEDLTIRTSIIGPELKKNGVGLFHWFMNQTGEIKGYTKAIWSGITTLELAKAISTLLQEKTVGLVHLTNGIKIEKYELLCLMRKIWQREDISITPIDGKKCDKSLIKSERIFYTVPSYEEMLNEQKKWMENRKELYAEIYQI